MHFYTRVIKITTFILLSTTFTQVLSSPFKGPNNLDKHKKGHMYEEDDSIGDDSMEVDDERTPYRHGIINIQNVSKRPFTIICWNHREDVKRNPEFEPMDEYEIKFDRLSNLYWDCSVTSIDEDAYTKKLKNSISKYFRAWTNTNYPPYMSQGTQSSLEKAAIAHGRMCNKCYWILDNDGIYHVFGDYSNMNGQYIFAFFWDIRGHKRIGDLLNSERYKMKVETKYEHVPTWNKEEDGEILHLINSSSHDYKRSFENEMKFANKQENVGFDDEDGDDNEDV